MVPPTSARRLPARSNAMVISSIASTYRPLFPRLLFNLKMALVPNSAGSTGLATISSPTSSSRSVVNALTSTMVTGSKSGMSSPKRLASKLVTPRWLVTFPNSPTSSSKVPLVATTNATLVLPLSLRRSPAALPCTRSMSLFNSGSAATLV
jgi:hypothetical protein